MKTYVLICTANSELMFYSVAVLSIVLVIAFLSVRPSVCLSVCHMPILYQNE